MYEANVSTEIFGRTLRKIRESRGISRMELTRMTGLAETTIINWEFAIHSPTLYNMVILANALDVSLNELAGWE